MASENKVGVDVAVGVTGQQDLGALNQQLGQTGQQAQQVGQQGQVAGAGLDAAAAAARDAGQAGQQAASGAQASAQGWNEAGNAAEDAAAKHGKLPPIFTDLAKAVGGLFAAAKIKGYIEDTIALADAYGQMAERIKMATPEAAEYDMVQRRILESANLTYRPLAEQQELYIRTAGALRDLKYVTSEALDITDSFSYLLTTNAASAERASGAIDAYTKSIQSGQVDARSWQAILAAMPTVVDSIAAATGRSAAEIRQMGITGNLAVHDLNEGLRKSVEVNKEAAAGMSATVKDAVTRLANTWQVYVGEANKASGATKDIVKLLDTLSANLDTVVKVAVKAGEAVVVALGMKALGALKSYIAQQVLAATSATEGAAATARHTAAVTANTAALGANAVAARGSAAAIGAHAAASQVAAAGMGTAGGAVAGVTSKLGGLAMAARLAGRFFLPLAALDFALNFRKYGEWIGEAAAKLMGYKDRSEELTRQWKIQDEIIAESIAMKRELARKIQEAIDKQFELSNAAKDSIKNFDDLTKSGTKAAEAVKEITKGFDLTKFAGIKDFSATLDKLSADGKLAAGEVQDAWAKALDGKDLLQFETMARTAFAGSAREAERLAQLTDATLREAVKRTGLDYDVLQGKIGAVSRSAINDTEQIINGLDRLKNQGIDTGRALTASLSKAIANADSQAALDSIRGQIEQVRKVLGDKVADGFLDEAARKARELQDAIDGATPGINSLREAFAELGLKSREELDQTAKRAQQAFNVITEAGQQEGESYLAWQERKRKAAETMIQRMIEANGGIADIATQTRAAQEGVTLAIDETGRAAINAADKSEEAARRMSKGWNDVAGATDKARQSARSYGAEVEKLGGQTYNKDKWASDESGKALSFGMNESSFNQYIARNFGEQFIGNQVAAKAANIKMQLDYWDSLGLKDIDGSMGDMRRELERLKREMYQQREQERQARQQKQDGGGTGGASTKSGPLPQASEGAGASKGAGATYVNNYTLPGGQRHSVTLPDAANAQALDTLVRQLWADKARAA